MASHDDDDDDPVVAEYKVFVSQALGGRLHLFQYPLRNADRHYELSSRTLTVTKGVGESANPNNKLQAMSPASLPGPTSRFEMKMRLDISSSDSFKGRRRGGPGGGGGAGNGGMDSPMNSMDLLEGRAANADSAEEDPGVYKYTLESQPATLQSSYAAALFMRDEVHITPINTVQQFGPKITAEQTDDSFLSSLRADVSTSSAMMNHLERQLHRLRSVVLEEDAKTAVPVDFFESYSVESATVARQFPFTGKATDPMSSLGMAMDPKGRPPFRPLPDALSHYFPIESCGSRDESFRQSRPTVLRYAHLTHTINDQVKALLQSAVLLTVAQVTEVVRCIDGPQPRTDRRGYETQIVAALKRYAVLVHGTWAATYDTSFRGAQAFLRENVLLTFATSTRGAVTFAEAAAPVRGHVFHERTVRAILESIASLDKSTKQWVLRGSAEGTAWMQDNFPDEVEFQRQQWARRSSDILRNIDSLLSGRLPPKQHLRLPIQPPVAGVTPNRSQSAPAPLLSLKPEPTAATAMDDVEARATAIRFLRLTVQQVGVVSSELMREHIRASIQKPSCILNRCSLPVVQEAAKDTLQTFTKGTWILKSVDAATDAYRASLIHAMRQKPSFTSKEIVADAEEILNRDSPAERRALPTTVVSAVLDELAEYHSGERLYHVKTGRVTFSPPAPGTMV